MKKKSGGVGRFLTGHQLYLLYIFWHKSIHEAAVYDRKRVGDVSCAIQGCWLMQLLLFLNSLFTRVLNPLHLIIMSKPLPSSFYDSLLLSKLHEWPNFKKGTCNEKKAFKKPNG